MLEKIIGFSLKYKLIVILFTLSVAGFGIYAVFNIPVGTVPDITNNQVQVITTSNNLSTEEIEQFITAPIELEMANLPGVTEIRSISKFGLSVVTIVFEESMGTYLPRQLIAEKIKSASANIPEGFGTPEMGPITTGLGEIYQYTLEVKPEYKDRYSVMDLRTIQDWIVKRQLSGIKGVVEVNSWGGYLKQYEVAIDPVRLQAMDVTLMDVYEAMQNNNSISGGGYIEKNANSYFIRGDAQIKSLEDIGNIVVKNRQGIPVLISHVADVKEGYANRYGAITGNGEGEKVFGQIMMLKNANSKEVINAVKQRVEEVQKTLPEGIFINPVLERSELIGKTSLTVFENILFGCIIVFLVVLILLGNLRSAIVIASMIPLSLFFTLSMMYIFGIDANLMSLGALDFGIIIDGAVIIAEFVAVRLLENRDRLATADGDMRHKMTDSITYEGVTKMMQSAIFGQLIILIVFIPILSLQGVEGKMFRPMALAFSFAIMGAMLFCLTWLPVVISLFLKPHQPKKTNLSEKVLSLAMKTYIPVIKWSMWHKKTVLSLSFASLIFSGLLLANMGGEFVPTMDEGDFVIQPVLKTGTSLSKTIEMTTQMETILKKKFPEIAQVVCRIGAAEVPTDPMSMEEIDMIIKLKPKNEWVSAASKEELADKLKEALMVIPGVDYEFTQPIEMRFNELITGVRSDIAVKIFGDDLDDLNRKANEIKVLAEKIPGAADVIIEKTTGLPQMNVKYNRSKIAMYGVDAQTLNTFLATAFGGKAANNVFEGEKRFDMVLRLKDSNRKDINDIRQLQIPLPNGQMIPLCEVADIDFSEGPAKISRENTHRRVVVSVNVRNRDLKSVVQDIRTAVEKNITLSPGTYIKYGGQFENLQNATNRLAFAVPISLALIFIFLHFAFKSLKDTIMIFTAIPMSIVGGVITLWIRGMSFSISAGVGFIALFGVAVLNGIVLIERLKHLKQEGMEDMKKLILEGTTSRLRPVMLTAMAAAMGFLPMAVSTGAGAEVQRPLATVVIGGLVTSTMLTMIVLPLMFMIFNDKNGWAMTRLKLLKPKQTLFLTMLLSVAGMASAQPQSVTLGQAIDIALKHNKEYRSGVMQVEAKKTLASKTFDVDKTKVYYNYDETNISEIGKQLHTFGIEQTFAFPTVYTQMKKTAAMAARVAESELKSIEYRLTKQVTAVYHDMLLMQSEKNYYNTLKSIYDSLYTHAQIRNRVGDISRLDLYNAEAKKRQTDLALEQLEYDLRTAQQQFDALLQDGAEHRVATGEPELIEVVPPVVSMLPDMEQKKLQAEYMKSMVKLEKMRLLPDITLGYFNSNNPFSSNRAYHSFEVGINIPLFTGAKKAGIKAANLEIEAQRRKMENDIVLLEAKQRQLELELSKQQKTIDYYRTSGKQLSEEIMRAATKSHQAGSIDYYQLAMSIENAMNILKDYYQAVAKYNRTAVEINYLSY